MSKMLRCFLIVLGSVLVGWLAGPLAATAQQAEPERVPDAVLANEESLATGVLRVWDGGGTDDLWTTPANWIGDVAPQPGDDLEFPAATAQLTATNDFPNATRFNSIRLSGNNYHLRSNSVLMLDAGIVTTNLSGTNFLDVGAGLYLETPQTFTSTHAGTMLEVRNGLMLSNTHLTVAGAGNVTMDVGEESATANTLTKNGSGTLLVVHQGPTNTRINVVVNAGTLQLEGGTYSTINLVGGTLTGNASVGNIIATGGIISPGDESGMVSPPDHTGRLLAYENISLNAGSTFAVDIDGLTTCYDYDCIEVALDAVDGAPNLGNSTLSVSLGFTPNPGDTFSILLVSPITGTQPVTGTFNGLPEGATFTVGTTQFAISYVGGDGNDVVLTVQAPTALTLTALTARATNADWHPAFGLIGLLVGRWVVGWGWRRAALGLRLM
jgi:hypothetical protein